MSFNSAIKAGKFYLNNGKEDVDGSLRLCVDVESNIGIFQKRVLGVWQPGSLELGSNTLWIGKNVGLASVGHHLTTETSDGDIHMHVHSSFDGEVTTKEARILNAFQFTSKLEAQPDDTGVFTGSILSWATPAVSDIILSKLYYYTSSAATDNIRIRFYKGADDTGALIFDQTYPQALFPENSEVELSLVGDLEFTAGNTYAAKITSEGTFSLKSNAAQTMPHYEVDVSYIREDNLIQTKPWVSGDSYSSDDWLIESGKIYICNTTGVQTGTFESNSDKWETLDKALHLVKTIQTTGILEGGLITAGSAVTLNWTAGEGVITNYSDPVNATTKRVSWGAVNGYSPTHLGTTGQWIITYNENGEIEELPATDIGPELIRSNIVIGGFSTYGPYVFRVVDNAINLGFNGFNSFKDFIRDIIGPANIHGNTLTANGTNLSLDTDGGEIFILGSNFRNSTINTDELTIAPGTAITFSRVFRQASPSTDISPDGAGMVDVINPTKWDDGSGVLQTVPINDYTVQVMYLMMDGGYVLCYGQEVFAKQSAAEEAVYQGSVSFEEYPVLQKFVRRCFLIVKGNETDLNNAVLVSDGKFRVGGVSSGVIKSHSSLNELEFDISGHTFENGGDLNIGAYNFLTSGIVTLSGSTFRNDAGTFCMAKDDVATYPSIQNVFNNFNNYLGLLIKKTDTGTGDFLDIQNSAGVSQFKVGTAGLVTTANDLNVTGVISATDYIHTDNYFSVTGLGTDGAMLLNFNMERKWAFQQEGSGTACALRLRNTLGQNKNFFIDTDGLTTWRSYNGAITYASVGPLGYYGALRNGVSAVTQTDGDDSTKVATTAYVEAHAGGHTVNGIWTKTGALISPTVSSDSITMTSGGIYLTSGKIDLTGGDLDLNVGSINMTSGNINVNSGNVDIAGDLTVATDIYMSTVNKRLYASDNKGYFEFGLLGNMKWFDVDAASSRIIVDSVGSYLISPDATKYIVVKDAGLDVRALTSHSYLTIDTDNDAAYDSGIRFRQSAADQWVIYSDHGNGNFYFNENTSDTRMILEAGGDVSILAGLDVTGDLTLGNDILCGTTFYINDGTTNRLNFGTILSRVNSPDDTAHLEVSNTHVALINGSVVQVNADDTATTLRSPDGTSTVVALNNTDAQITGDVKVTGQTHLRESAGSTFINLDSDASAAYDQGIRFQSDGVNRWVLYNDTSHSALYLNYQTNLMRIKIEPSRIRYNDVTRDRVDIHATGTVLIGPLGEATFTIDDADAFDFNSTTHAVLMPRMTTAQRTAITPQNGMLLYDNTLNQSMTYENGSWRQV